MKSTEHFFDQFHENSFKMPCIFYIQYMYNASICDIRITSLFYYHNSLHTNERQYQFDQENNLIILYVQHYEQNLNMYILFYCFQLTSKIGQKFYYLKEVAVKIKQAVEENHQTFPGKIADTSMEDCCSVTDVISSLKFQTQVCCSVLGY